MAGLNNGLRSLEAAPLLETPYKRPSPDTITKLVKRLRALTLTLLPVEVDPVSIKEPTSSVITPQVISAYIAAAGDFVDALPYCLIRARVEFMYDANHNPADYGENHGRATACEVLARRIVHLSPRDRLPVIMSSRFQHRQVDGDLSDMSSSLEMAIDSNCIIFLSSDEAQQVVNALWSGDLIQKNNENNEIDYVPYADTRDHTFLGHWDPSRLSVPRYQNIFRIVVWLFFLVVYSQAVREPLDRLNVSNAFETWEIILYVMALSFVIEDAYKVFLVFRFSSWRAFNFWSIVATITNALLLSAFILRALSLTEDEDSLRYKSFQVLSFVAPFIWMKIITVFDGYKYVGTMQICIARMLEESGIFFALLSLLGLGFTQAMYALDTADGSTEGPVVAVHTLIQSLLGSSDYQRYSKSSPGLLLHYFWDTVTAIILLNVLISLFASAYSDIVGEAEAQYLAFFAGKTIGMIRAPDSYVYPAPFNLVETIFVAPFEVLPKPIRPSNQTYAKINRYVMGLIFCLPLAIIAFYEASRGNERNAWMTKWLSAHDQGQEDYPEVRDPEVDEADGMKISRVPFEELVKVFPNTGQSSTAYLAKEINGLKKQLMEITGKLG